MKYRLVRKMLVDADIAVRDPGKAGRESRWSDPEKHEQARAVTRRTWEDQERREQQSERLRKAWEDPGRPLYHWDRPGQRDRQRNAWLRRITATRKHGNKVPAAEVELREALKQAKVSFTAPAVVLDGLFIVDVLLPGHRTVIEADGASHNMDGAKERDNERDQLLKLAGYRVVRLSYREIATNALACVQSLNFPAEDHPVCVERTHNEALGELNRIRFRNR